MQYKKGADPYVTVLLRLRLLVVVVSGENYLFVYTVSLFSGRLLSY